MEGEPFYSCKIIKDIPPKQHFGNTKQKKQNNLWSKPVSIRELYIIKYARQKNSQYIYIQKG